jgi:hypothetical protein
MQWRCECILPQLQVRIQLCATARLWSFTYVGPYPKVVQEHWKKIGCNVLQTLDLGFKSGLSVSTVERLSYHYERPACKVYVPA